LAWNPEADLPEYTRREVEEIVRELCKEWSAGVAELVEAARNRRVTPKPERN
jgi:hypothetical protein